MDKNKLRKQRHEEIKYEVLSHYSIVDYPCCINCGFKDIRALCLDHINGDGGSHRKSITGYNRGFNLYRTLYNNNFESNYEFQTLCFNCNTIKYFEKKEGLYERTDEWKANISKALKKVDMPVGKDSRRALKVNQYETNGTLIKTWDCIKDAERYYNNNPKAKNIVAVCNGR